MELDSKKSPSSGGGANPTDSVVDELFGALKGGNYFKNRRQQQPPVGGGMNPNPNPNPNNNNNNNNNNNSPAFGGGNRPPGKR